MPVKPHAKEASVKSCPPALRPPAPQRSETPPCSSTRRSRENPLGFAFLLGVFSMKIAVSGVAAALIATTAPVAEAQTQPKKKDPKTAEAKKFFDEGSDAYAEGRYEDAVKAWEKSYELSGKALIFDSIANAYERLGDKKKAREYLARWRAEAPKAEHEQLDSQLKSLDARIAAADAAEKAKQEDEEKKKRSLAEQDKAKQEETKSQAKARSTQITAGIVVGAAGIAAVGAGIAVGAVGAGQRPDPNTNCAPSGGLTLCRSASKGAIESSKTMALVGDIVWIAGAAMAAGGVVLILTAPSANAPAKEPSKQGRSNEGTVSFAIAPVVSGTLSGAIISGTF